MSPTHDVIREGEVIPPQVAAMLATYEAREPQPTQRPVIALGLTLLREVDTTMLVRVTNLLRAHWWPGPVYHGRGGFGAAMARNNVLKQFFEDIDAGKKIDGLLFWDADQVPPQIIPGPLSWTASSGLTWQGGYFTEYLQWLLENEPKKSCIGGLYFSREAHWDINKDGQVRGAPHDPIAYMSPSGDGYRHLTPAELIPMLQRPGLYHVHAVGTGSMLIRTELLLKMRALKKPRAVFEAPMIGARAEQRHFELIDRLLQDETGLRVHFDALKDLRKWMDGQGGGDPGTQFTEDVFFCDEIQKRLGEWIWLDTAMQSAHIAEIWITSKHYLEAHGFNTEPHEQSLRERPPINQDRENERRKSRIVLPR